MAAANAVSGNPPEREPPRFVAVSAEGHRNAKALALALQQAMTCLDGLGALVHLRDRASGRLRLVAASGLAPERVGAWADLHPLADEAPARAVRHADYVWVGRDTFDRGSSGAAAVPLPGGGDTPVGALSVLAAADGEPDEVQRSFLRGIAGWMTVRLEGAPAGLTGVGAVTGSEQWIRVGELTAALAEALTSHDVVRAVARHVLPPFGADSLGIHSVDGDRLDTVGLVGHPPEYQGYWSRLRGFPVTSHPIIADVFRTGAPLFIETKAELLRRYPEMMSLTATSPKHAWAFLPLVASGRAIGCCVVSFDRPRSFSEEERALLTALSGLVAQALERARLYDRKHALAQGLQRELLPQALPSSPAVSARARYAPAGRGGEVGGDWYDVIPLSADRVAMVIGDVMGHGITEAATMGRLRTAVRTLAELEMPPDEVFSHLNDLVSELGEDFYATCLYAVFDPVARTCSFSLAGHPPPVVLRPDGTVHSPDVAVSPPLGAAEPPFDIHELRLPRQSLLVFFTDGLVESPGRDFDQGLVELRETLAESGFFPGEERADGTGDIDELCDTIMSSLLPDRELLDDDAALLIAHVQGMTADDVGMCELSADPQAASQARTCVREFLTSWGMDDLIVTTELLASELVSNAVLHASGPLRLRLLRGRVLTCEVYDGSLTTPRIRRAAVTDEGGRGLQLVAAISRRWGARYLRDGKCIWTEQDIPA